MNYNYTFEHGASSVMLGVCRNWGWYLRATFKNGFDFSNGSEYADENDRVSYRQDLDNESMSLLATGPMIRLSSWLYAYAGAGYGWYNISSSDAYSLVFGAEGVVVDAGLIARWKCFSLSAGYECIIGNEVAPKNARFGDIYVGLGFTLSGKTKNK